MHRLLQHKLFRHWGLPPILMSMVFSVSVHATDATKRTDSNPPPCPKLLTVAIIDGYSSAQFLPASFERLGFKAVHVHSNGRPREFQSGFDPKNFVADYAHQDFDNTAAWIKAWSPRAILPGAESGVLLSDRLAYTLSGDLQIPNNGVLTARRNKYELGQLLRNRGIPAIHEILSSDPQEVLSWVRKNKLLPGKVVVKAPASSGGNDVYFCRTEDEIAAKVKEVSTTPDKYGQLNPALVQEFLVGPEYVVNMASRDGRHVVTDIWQYMKRDVQGASNQYNLDRLLPSTGRLQDLLVEYVKSVLDAQGTPYTGLSHAEVILTERGPILVDLGFRAMGANQPRLATDAIGANPLDIAAEAFVRPDLFAERAERYAWNKHAAMVTIAGHGGGLVHSRHMVKRLESLPGYVRHAFFYEEGQATEPTVDMNTILGQVEFVHEDESVLNESIHQLRQWEEEGQFESLPSPKTPSQVK